MHPTSLRPEEDAAFAHAVRLATAHGASLEVVHIAGPILPGQREHFPDAQALLDAWEPDGSDAPLDWSTVLLPAGAPATALALDLQRNPADLVIMRTAARTGFDRVLHGSIAQALVNDARCRLLLLPRDVTGFVDAKTGQVDVRHVLIPVKNAFLAELALEGARALCAPLTHGSFYAHLLHVGDGDEPAVPPPGPRWTVERHTADGRVGEAIIAVGARVSADLVVLTTSGRHLLGRTLRHVLSNVRCPVLAIPEPL